MTADPATLDFEILERIAARLGESWTGRPDDFPDAIAALSPLAGGERNRIVVYPGSDPGGEARGGRGPVVQTP